MIMLKKAIQWIARVIEPDPERRKLIFDKQRMEIWREVFTDPALSLRSYEPYELPGDKKTNELIVMRAIKMHPQATEAAITNLLAYYGSNLQVLAPIMKGYFINVEVRRPTGLVTVKKNIVKDFMFLPDPKTGATLTDAIYADMFEAIMGGIYIIGESILRGLGDIYCSRWFDHIYVGKHPEFDISHFQGNATQIVETLLSRFSYYVKAGGKRLVQYKNVDKDVDGDEGVRNVTGWYEVSKELTDYISALDSKIAGEKVKNFRLYQPNITQVTGGLADEVKLESSRLFLDWLNNVCGINVEWAEKVKSYLDAQVIAMDPKLREDVAAIERYLARKNLSKDFFFNKLAKHSVTGKKTGIRILSTDNDGQKRVLFTRIIPTGSTYVARMEIIKKFAEEIRKNEE